MIKVLLYHFLVPIPKFGILFRFTSLLLVTVPLFQYFRCCNEDGLILKPSRPATAIDSYFIAVSLKDTKACMREAYFSFSSVKDMGD